MFIAALLCDVCGVCGVWAKTIAARLKTIAVHVAAAHVVFLIVPPRVSM